MVFLSSQICASITTVDLKTFRTSERHFYLSPLSTHSPKELLMYFLSLWVCLFWTISFIHKEIRNIFCQWLLSLSRVFRAQSYCSMYWYFLLWLNDVTLYGCLYSCSAVFNSLQPHGLQHARRPCPSPSPGVWSNWCPLSRWCHPTISSSVVLFSSCPQSFPASGSFPMNWLFTSGDQSSILYLLIDGHLGCFYFLTVLNSAATNTHVCIEITDHCVV